MTRERARNIGSVVLVAIASVATLIALVTGYANVALFDSDEFAERAVATLDDDNVRTFAGREITQDVVLRADRDLIAVQPIIESAASTIVGNSALRGLFRTAAREAHATLFTRDRDTIVFKVSDVGVLLIGALEQFQPKLAQRLPEGASAELVKLNTEASPLNFAQVAEDVDHLYWLMLVLALVCWLGALALSTERRRTFVHIGVGLATTGVLLLIAYSVTRGIVLGKIDDELAHDAAAAVWDAFLHDLRAWGWAFTGIGVVIAAAASSLIRPLDVDAPLKRAWSGLTTIPSRPWLRVVRALVLAAAGVLIVLAPQAALDFALLAVGIYLIYQGVSELLALIAKPGPRPDISDELEETAGRIVGRLRRVPAGAVAAGVAVIAIALLTVALLGGGGTSAAAPPIRACNGAEELCDRPLNEVVLPGTHNAMSAATNPGWLFPQQEKGIPQQLDDGIRALAIDSYYGRKATNGRVQTELETNPKGAKARAALEQEFGDEFVQAALRIRDDLGFSAKDKRKLWLCHGFCELGAIEMEATLRGVRDFLVANPHEVIAIVIEDSTTPEDTAEVFRKSGLSDYVYTGQLREGEFPTLREMIEDGGRVAVMMERHAGAVRWMHQAYAGLLQETPFKFTSLKQLEPPESCKPLRGPSYAPLFLINNWIDSSPAPRPSNAKQANAYDPLLARARACEKQRDRLPNTISVDFYKTGGLFKVVKTLNGLD